MKPKLTIELIPQSQWGLNLRKILKSKDWDIIRKMCYKKANFKCEICSGKGLKHPVECHEIWQYDDKNKIQILKGVTALCPSCHRVKHFGRQLRLGYGKNSFNHLKKVNFWTDFEAEMYLNQVFGKYHERSQYDWSLNVDIIPSLLNKKMSDT